MTYEVPNGHLSASSIKDILRCPKRYEFKYVKGMKSPGNKSLTLGSVTHKVFETYYKDAIEDKERFTPKQVVEMARDDTIPEWFDKNEAFVTPDERREIENAVPDIAENYVQNIGQYVVPVAVESMFTYESRCGVPIEGYLDLIRLKNGANHIVDYKIGGKPWPTSRLVDDLQFILYAYVTGMPNVQVQNIVTAPTAKMAAKALPYKTADPAGVGTYSFVAGPGLNVLGNDFGSGNGAYLEELIESCAKLVTSGIFPPTLPDNWWCSTKWCPYWGLCRGKKG